MLRATVQSPHPILSLAWSEMRSLAVDYSEIRYEQHGPVTVIAFNRPEVRNCIGPRTHRELIDAWTRFRDDPAASVAILTGTGDKAFCSGADLSAAQALLPKNPEEVRAHNEGRMPGIIGPSRMTDIYKPIIAAVNGVAYAGGLEWVCFADIRVAEEHATFGVLCRRWNIGLGDGGTQRLPRIVGMGRAIELIITGRVFDAQEAHRIGLVNEIVPRGKGMERAMELARFIAALPQEAIRTDKEAAYRGFGLELREGLKVEAECFNRLIGSPATAEGIRRFLERDHPDRRPGQAPVTPGLH
jgi:enoyl-CoA hydratase